MEQALKEVYAAEIKIKVRLDENLVVTPRDTSEPEIIKKELLQNNFLEFNYIFPVQGEKLSF